MIKAYRQYFIILLMLICIQTDLLSQALSTGFPVIQDFYRRQQLLGKISSEHSFVSYPLFPSNAFNVDNPFDPQKNLKNYRQKGFDGKFEFDNNTYILTILPVNWNQQYVSHHPDEFNDGSMVPARGYQSYFSTGFYFKYDHLSIKIQPEFVHAFNPEYSGFPLTREEPAWAIRRWWEYYDFYLTYIDQPERFGENEYSKLFWGQSSIRLTFNSISVGFSTENLWWGPGMRNSLLMTNTAPGFAHFTLNSVKPIKTPIGSFEGQIIGGWLKESGYPPPNHEVEYNGTPFYNPKRKDGRYLNAAIVSYQPKWVPGLFIGLIRSFQVYHPEMGDEVLDYFPIFTAFGLEAAEKDGLNEKKRDSYNSVFFRFVWPESHIEVYAEYGRSDYYWDNRDKKVQLEHSVAYNLGFRKLVTLNKNQNKYLQFHAEITQLAKNANTILRNGRSWYASNVVPHGYTHRGQILGAGIGSGSNSQTLNISWIKSLKSIGLQFERLVHNEDFFHEYINEIRMHWVDFSTTLIVNWDYKKLLLLMKLKGTKSYNYQWVYDINPDEYWDNSAGRDILNFHGQLSVIYRF